MGNILALPNVKASAGYEQRITQASTPLSRWGSQTHISENLINKAKVMFPVWLKKNMDWTSPNKLTSKLSKTK